MNSTVALLLTLHSCPHKVILVVRLLHAVGNRGSPGVHRVVCDRATFVVFYNLQVGVHEVNDVEGEDIVLGFIGMLGGFFQCLDLTLNGETSILGANVQLIYNRKDGL